jgi:excisionase family DNA binding protein
MSEPVALMIDVREVAGLLGVSVATIERMVKANDFPAPFTVNKRLKRWSRLTVTEWVAEQQAAATALPVTSR